MAPGEFLRLQWETISRVDHDRWWAWPTGGISLSWIGGIIGQVDGTHLINLTAMGIFSCGASFLGLFRLWELNQARKLKQGRLDEIEVEKARDLKQIEIDEARRASLARIPISTIVATTEPPPDVLPPAKDLPTP